MNIEDRVIRLERENRRLKVSGLFGLLLVASVFVMGQARVTDEVRARSIVVVDDGGAVVASLGSSFVTNTDGTRETVGGVLTIYRGGGRPGQINVHYLDGPDLSMSDGQSQWMALQVLPTGGRITTSNYDGSIQQSWP